MTESRVSAIRQSECVLNVNNRVTTQRGATKTGTNMELRLNFMITI